MRNLKTVVILIIWKTYGGRIALITDCYQSLDHMLIPDVRRSTSRTQQIWLLWPWFLGSANQRCLLHTWRVWWTHLNTNTSTILLFDFPKHGTYFPNKHIYLTNCNCLTSRIFAVGWTLHSYYGNCQFKGRNSQSLAVYVCVCIVSRRQKDDAF
jgi:hypothetical protein